LQKKGPAVPFTLPPDSVAQKVIHAMEAKTPRIRYYVTFPTYLFGYLKRILPARKAKAFLRKSLLIGPGSIKERWILVPYNSRRRVSTSPSRANLKVIHAMEAKTPRIRYYVTFPTYLFGYLKRILPARLLDYLARKV
jgi:hypothetical protein